MGTLTEEIFSRKIGRRVRQGEIVVAPVDVSALRHERPVRVGHPMPSHLRTEAYPVYGRGRYPPRAKHAVALSYEENVRRIEAAKHDLE